VARLSGAACCIIGEITTRFFNVSERIAIGWNNRGSSGAVME
jgi:hypothetical protein